MEQDEGRSIGMLIRVRFKGPPPYTGLIGRLHLHKISRIAVFRIYFGGGVPFLPPAVVLSHCEKRLPARLRRGERFVAPALHEIPGQDSMVILGYKNPPVG